MGVINFILTDNTSEYAFNKDNFVYMSTVYSTGLTGTVFVYLKSQGDLIFNDVITLTVKLDRMNDVVKYISENIMAGNYTEIKHSQTTGIGKFITAMTYTSG